MIHSPFAEAEYRPANKTTVRTITILFGLMALLTAQGLVAGQNIPIPALAAWLSIPVVLASAMFASGTMMREAVGFDRVVVTAIVAFALSSVVGFGLAMTSEIEAVANSSQTLLLSAVMQLPVYIAIVLAARSLPVEKDVEIISTGLFIALMIVCIFELIMPIAGFEHVKKDAIPQAASPAMLLGQLGFTMNRFLMPISTGMTNACVIPLFLFSICWFRRKSVVVLAAMICSTLILVLSDSRAYMASLAVGFLLFYLFRRYRKFLTFIACLLPASLFIIVTMKSIFPGLLEMASTRSDAFGLFSGREYLWNVFLTYLGQQSLGAFLFGNGIFGQVSSGLIAQYGFMFTKWGAGAQDLAHLHNSYLQIFIDGGMVALLTYIFLIARTTKNLLFLADQKTVQGNFWSAMLVFFIGILSVSNAEVTISFYGREGLTLFILVVLLSSLFARKRDASKRNEDHQKIKAHPIMITSIT